ncbi:MAG: BON domain-containing protein [Coleofasciculus chthonoplastes F3-SA18-01]|uniref:BON domain-containing protein n=1 Tax=Coleofasciculus chthonoplastes TaxID=64178 RepID=UPI0032F7BB1A
MNMINVLMIIATLAIASLVLVKPNRLFRSAMMLLGVAIFTFNSAFPAFAAPPQAAVDSSQGSQQPNNEKVTTSAVGNQYQGIEYVESSRGGKELSDAQIQDKIESDISENLVAGVASGAVRLTGTVTDQATARKIVKKIKDIPGVHEITFDLAIENIPS